MSELGVLGSVCAGYLLLVVGVTVAAMRARPPETHASKSHAEAYFLAGRSARTLVLFMALLGTNVTPFVLMGIPGIAYHHGVGVFGLNAAIVALGIPLTFWIIGEPARRAARALGAVTPAELYAARLRSPALGFVLFGVFTLYTVPYLVASVLGVGVAVSVLTGDAISLESAAVGLLVFTVLYTSVGGMRATMWTNVVQGTLFVGFVVVAFFGVAQDLGGFAAVTRRVAEQAPHLLVKGDDPMFAAAPWASWGLAISLTVIAFPHMLVRIFAARDASALRNTARIYPVALLLLWLPVVLLGVWGAVVVPGLEGKSSDAIFVLLVQRTFGPWMQGLCLAGVLAAVMSTIDAQFLTLGSMLSRDVLRRVRPGTTAREQVTWSRAFMLLLAGLTAAFVILRPASIFAIASLSFSGYVTVVPTLYLGLRSARFTQVGALASIGLGNAVLLLAWAQPAPWWGVLPVGWGFGAACLGAWVGSRWGHVAPSGPVPMSGVSLRDPTRG